jgi:hypothetical protein
MDRADRHGERERRADMLKEKGERKAPQRFHAGQQRKKETDEGNDNDCGVEQTPTAEQEIPHPVCREIDEQLDPEGKREERVNHHKDTRNQRVSFIRAFRHDFSLHRVDDEVAHDHDGDRDLHSAGLIELQAAHLHALQRCFGGGERALTCCLCRTPDCFQPRYAFVGAACAKDVGPSPVVAVRGCKHFDEKGG